MERIAVFAGCSFTWGQGLWSYAPTKWYVPTCDEYTEENAPIPPSADEFRIENRFAGLVAKEISWSPAIVKRWNGGTDEESIRFIREVKENHVSEHSLLTMNLPWENVEWVIFQTTQCYRTPFFFFHKNQEYAIRSNPELDGFSICDRITRDENDNPTYHELPNYDIFLEWLVDNNHTPEDFISLHTKQIVNNIESLFRELEEEGKNVYILSWTDEYLYEIKKRNYFDDKFVRIEYNDKEYDCIETLMDENKETQIRFDNTRLHYCGGDAHPSLNLHRSIANSIIKKVKEKLL